MCVAVNVRVLFTSWCLPGIGLFLIVVCLLLVCAFYELLSALRGLFILKVPIFFLLFISMINEKSTNP